MHRSVQVHANLSCPYSTLGLPATADEAAVKRAYRHLAKQYHPDVNTSAEASVRFLSIQEAYEILTGKSAPRHRGSSNSKQHADWEFHDWYWSFTTKRRWEAQQQGKPPGAPGSAAPGSAAPQTKSVLRSQLAGLRQRAAIRHTQQQHTCEASAAEPAKAQAQQHAAPAAEYDSTEMSDGVNMAAGVDDPSQLAHQPPPRPKFTPTETHKQALMGQLAGLKRRSDIRQRVSGQQAASGSDAWAT